MIPRLFVLFCLSVPLCAQQVPLASEKLDNQAIVTMVNAGLSDDIVITKIRSTPAQFDVSAQALAGLKNNGVSERVILAMLETANPQLRQSQPPPAVASAPAPAGPASREPARPTPETVDVVPTESIHTGWIHDGCKEFTDREDVISKGVITWVKVCHGGRQGYVNGVQLGYGDHEGSFLGFQARGLALTGWTVPVGEQIVRVEGQIAGYYVSQLRFVTDRGSSSPLFGGKSGTAFVASDRNGLPLRTIGVWANLKRHPSLNRAVASMTFKFGEPQYFEPVDSEAKMEHLRRYAPRVWFHGNESYWPASVEWSFHFLKRYWSSDSRMWWLITKEPLKAPSSILPYFHGADPKKQWTDFPLRLEDVPAYAFWHQVNAYTVDLVYFFYYPYNRGKEVAGTIFGSHVGDWEHVTVRLTARRDSEGRTCLTPATDAKMSFSLAYHSKDARYAWAQVPKVEGSDHPIIYSAHGSHGSYLEPGSHRYDSAAGKDLVDHTGAGTPWDTWDKLECFDYDTKKGLGPTWVGTWPTWLRKDRKDKGLGNEDPASGPVTRWGNYRSGAVNTVFGGTQYRLEHGPTGPADKPYFETPGLE